MADHSAIEWTDATWNPIRARNKVTGKVGWHCEHATTGCEFCYAEGFNKRLGTGLDFKPGHRKDIELFLDKNMLTQPLRWKKPRMIFVCSMTDLFADFVPDEWIDQIIAVMALSPQHTFQVLTKRATRMRDYVASAGRVDLIRAAMVPSDKWVAPNIVRRMEDLCWPLSNVWLGVSTERQQEGDERIPLLLQTPAAVRFISAEPLLGPVDLLWINTAAPGRSYSVGANLNWVIVGGESGHDARPMHPDWARSLRVQCEAAGVPFFFKQWGEWVDCEDYTSEQQESYDVRGLTADGVIRVGKKAAGRHLDGVLHDAMPQADRRGRG